MYKMRDDVTIANLIAAGMSRARAEWTIHHFRTNDNVKVYESSVGVFSTKWRFYYVAQNGVAWQLPEECIEEVIVEDLPDHDATWYKS